MNDAATLGYVLPASSLLLGGWGKLRELLLDRSDLTAAQARNKGGWLFEDVHNSYAVVLLTRRSTSHEPKVELWPGVRSEAQLRSASGANKLSLSRSVLESLSDSVVVPWLNEAAERDVFETIRAHPALSGGAGWINGSHDARWDFRGSGPHNRFASREETPGAWRVLMTRHVVPYAIDTGPAFQQFLAEPAALGNGVEGNPAGAALGREHPLIIVRHPSRNDDSRTMIATALPLRGFIHNKGYVHAVRHAPATDPQRLLALLGFLNTFTCDWWVRRFVDRHITAPVLNNVRLPSWTSDQIAEAATLAGALLASRGTTELAGGVQAEVADGSEFEWIVRLEALAAAGFGLNRAELEIMLGDFSDRPAACPPAVRSAVLGSLT